MAKSTLVDVDAKTLVGGLTAAQLERAATDADAVLTAVRKSDLARLGGDVDQAEQALKRLQPDVAKVVGTADVKALVPLLEHYRQRPKTADKSFPAQFAKALGVDLSDLEATLVDSGLVEALLPDRVIAWARQEIELLPLDWSAFLVWVLTHGIGLRDPGTPTEPTDTTLLPPWPIARSQPTDPLWASADTSGHLEDFSELAEVGASQNTAMVGIPFDVPANCSHIRLDPVIADSGWYVGVTTGLGYASASQNVGLGLWDGGTQLAFNETQLGSAYAPVLWSDESDGGGQLALSLDYPRTPSATDETYLVGVILRGTIGGGGLVAGGATLGWLNITGLRVRMAFS